MNIGRVVFDTNVIVSASLSRNGNPANVYKMFLAGTLTLFFCEAIFTEYKDVLYRPHLKILPSDADSIMTAVRQDGKKVMVTPSIGSMPDEDDRVFYDTAKTAGACLITGNIKHYPSEQFILTPSAFLELLEYKS